MTVHTDALAIIQPLQGLTNYKHSLLQGELLQIRALLANLQYTPKFLWIPRKKNLAHKTLHGRPPSIPDGDGKFNPDGSWNHAKFSKQKSAYLQQGR